MTTVLLTLGLLLTGCQQGPTFLNIESVKVQRVGSDGLHGVELSITEQRKLVECLYGTREVNPANAEDEILLQDVYLVEIKDKAGIRSFELYTANHLKGNKGKYYRNGCLYPLIKSG